MDNILLLCIGDSNIVGDSLGPLIGSFIQRNKEKFKNNIEVIGTMELPVGYKRLNKINRHIKLNKYGIIIIIDSALGSQNNIGRIIIDNSNLCAGKGVNSGKYLNGDITIRGIVGKNHNNVTSNAIELKNVSVRKIDDMARQNNFYNYSYFITFHS